MDIEKQRLKLQNTLRYFTALEPLFDGKLP
jgi:hypothetical protein